MTKEQRPVHLLDKFATSLSGGTTAYCGVNIENEPYFLDAEHAATSVRLAEGGLMCPECCKRIIEILSRK